MSALLGAASITTKGGEALRLQTRHESHDNAPRWGRYRFARPNGWHCGHWHATPEDALGCVVAKGAPMA